MALNIEGRQVRIKGKKMWDSGDSRRLTNLLVQVENPLLALVGAEQCRLVVIETSKK